MIVRVCLPTFSAIVGVCAYMHDWVTPLLILALPVVALAIDPHVVWKLRRRGSATNADDH